MIPKLKSGAKFISLDLSDKMIEEAEKRKANYFDTLNQEFKKKIDHTFVIGNALDLSQYEDESFDVVLMPLLLHLVKEPAKVIKEAFRIVKKGGRLGCSVLGPKEKCTYLSLVGSAMDEFV